MPAGTELIELKKINWGKLALEVTLLIASIYVAIVLEGLSDDRARKRDAVQALVSLRAELQQDIQDVSAIIEAQADRDVRHRRLDRWLTQPATIPTDSFGVDLTALTSLNRTMFPRSAAWTTMVSSAQLVDLGDPRLVDRMANLYENLNVRLEYNGALYDESVTDLARNSFTRAWDPAEGRLLASSDSARAQFRAQLAFAHQMNLGFLDLLTGWRGELRAVQAEVDAYLTEERGGT